MKSIHETLQQKEQEFKRLEIEIGILRAAQSILDETEQLKESPVAGAAQPSGPPAGSPGYSAPAHNSDGVVSTIPPNAGFYSASSASEPRTDTVAADRPRRSFP